MIMIMKLMYYMSNSLKSFRISLCLEKMHIKRYYSTVFVSEFLQPCVILSKSNNIFKNLAFEHWIYNNIAVTSNDLLLLWINKPAVVIGRHQNPWLESNFEYLKEKNIDIARRNSGGGTVYHDLGNLNCTFFTHRTNYCRKKNLQFICEILNKYCNLEPIVSPRDDIRINDHKISGTASKLSRDKAYHHFTLLVNTDKDVLLKVLQPFLTSYESNATQSINSNIACLTDFGSDISIDNIKTVIAAEFLKRHNLCIETHYFEIDPSELYFPGLNNMYNYLQSWEWIYGFTPKFHIILDLPNQQSSCKVEIVKGRINKLEMNLNCMELTNYMNNLFCNLPFKSNLIYTILDNLKRFQSVRKSF